MCSEYIRNLMAYFPNTFRLFHWLHKECKIHLSITDKLSCREHEIIDDGMMYYVEYVYMQVLIHYVQCHVQKGEKIQGKWYYIFRSGSTWSKFSKTW